MCDREQQKLFLTTEITKSSKEAQICACTYFLLSTVVAVFKYNSSIQKTAAVMWGANIFYCIIHVHILVKSETYNEDLRLNPYHI